MDEAGVDASVMMLMDHGVGLGDEGVIPIEEKNRLCAEATRRHPGRLYTFYGVDPQRPTTLASDIANKPGLCDDGRRSIRVKP